MNYQKPVLLRAILIFSIFDISIALAQTERQRICGAYALAKCMSHLGFPLSPKDLADSMPNGGDYSSMGELATTARQHGLLAQGVRWGGEIPSEQFPAIIAVVASGNRQHFVAALAASQDRILVRDGNQEIWASVTNLRNSGWDGTALRIAVAPASFRDRPDATREQYWIAATLFSFAGILVWRLNKIRPASA